MDQYSEMLNKHIIVATFVTTLVGTGGNAGTRLFTRNHYSSGNQAGAIVISKISTGEINPTKPLAIIRVLR